jgi:hypothetical protein
MFVFSVILRRATGQRRPVYQSRPQFRREKIKGFGFFPATLIRLVSRREDLRNAEKLPGTMTDRTQTARSLLLLLLLLLMLVVVVVLLFIFVFGKSTE